MIRKLSFFYLIIFSSLLRAGDEPDHLAACNAFIKDTPEQIQTDTPEIQFKKGLFWRIEKDGKKNYIFGTMHSQDDSVSTIPPEVRLALIKSKTFLIETLPNEEANQAFLNMMYFKDKQRLDTLLEPELLEALSIKIQDYGVLKEHANFVKPWAAFSLIGRPKPTRAQTLESNLYQLAQENNLQLKSLETMEEILSALDGLAIEDQVTILKDTICNHEQIIRDTQILIDLYLNRDLQGIVEFNNQPHHDEAIFKRFIQRILYDRNTRMLERIVNEFKTGDVFVAVGASHLADEKGLLNELDKLGYKLSVIY
jgi:uncharacterized protein